MKKIVFSVFVAVFWAIWPSSLPAVSPAHATGSAAVYNSEIKSNSGTTASEPNSVPQLSDGIVSPNYGNIYHYFMFEVHYSDQDQDPPSTALVYIDGVPYSMQLSSGNRWEGTYIYTTELPEGVHQYYFLFSDGNGGSTRHPESGSINGPKVISPPPELFVAPPPVGNDNYDGLSPDYPLATIGQAVNIAHGTNDQPATIHVAAGEYKESIKMGMFYDEHIKLEGGWKIDFSERWDFRNGNFHPPKEYEVVIWGDEQKNNCVDLSWTEGISIDGITFRECRPGISSYESSGEIRNCYFFSNNWGIEVGELCYLLIDNSVFVNNDGALRGINHSFFDLKRSIFKGNFTYDSGGAIRAEGTYSIINTLFLNNYAFEYGGAIFTGGNARGEIRNCTFANNHSDDNGGGIAIWPEQNTGQIKILNSILWYNSISGTFPSSEEPQIYVRAENTVIQYNDIDQNGFNGLNGNIRLDPKFVDPGDGNFHLDYGSPCINAGSENGINPDGQTDIGAYPAVIVGKTDWNGKQPDHNLIQDAIDEINGFGAGGSVIITPGIYQEKLYLYPRIDLIGETPINTLIDAGGTGHTIVAKRNNYIKGLNITNSGALFIDSGVMVDGENVVVENNVINNIRYGIWTQKADTVIRNNLIVVNGNNADTGIVIGLLSTGTQTDLRPKIINNTIDGSSKVGSSGIVWINQISIPNIVNNIVSNFHSAGVSVGFAPVQNGNFEVIKNNCLWNNGKDFDGIPDLIGYYGNINGDPKFLDEQNENYQLTAGSACIDAGTSDGTPKRDMNGRPRFDDPETPNTGSGDSPFYDIGAMEYIPACQGDYEADGDIDGSDIYELIIGNNPFDVNIFAQNFGITECVTYQP